MAISQFSIINKSELWRKIGQITAFSWRLFLVSVQRKKVFGSLFFNFFFFFSVVEIFSELTSGFLLFFWPCYSALQFELVDLSPVPCGQMPTSPKPPSDSAHWRPGPQLNSNLSRKLLLLLINKPTSPVIGIWPQHFVITIDSWWSQLESPRMEKLSKVGFPP